MSLSVFNVMWFLIPLYSSSLILPCNEPNHRYVVCKLHKEVVYMGGGAVMSTVVQWFPTTMVWSLCVTAVTHIIPINRKLVHSPSNTHSKLLGTLSSLTSTSNKPNIMNVLDHFVCVTGTNPSTLPYYSTIFVYCSQLLDFKTCSSLPSSGWVPGLLYFTTTFLVSCALTKPHT